MMVKLLSDCKRGAEPQGIAVDYFYLFRRQCLSIKYIVIKKVYLVTHCHYETKSTITVNTFDILAGTLLVIIFLALYGLDGPFTHLLHYLFNMYRKTEMYSAILVANI